MGGIMLQASKIMAIWYVVSPYELSVTAVQCHTFLTWDGCRCHLWLASFPLLATMQPVPRHDHNTPRSQDKIKNISYYAIRKMDDVPSLTLHSDCDPLKTSYWIHKRRKNADRRRKCGQCNGWSCTGGNPNITRCRHMCWHTLAFSQTWRTYSLNSGVLTSFNCAARAPICVLCGPPCSMGNTYRVLQGDTAGINEGTLHQ